MAADEIRKMLPLGGKRRHTFCSVDRNGTEMWVDLTVLRKGRSIDSVPVYRMVGELLLYDHYERVSRLQEKELY